MTDEEIVRDALDAAYHQDPDIGEAAEAALDRILERAGRIEQAALRVNVTSIEDDGGMLRAMRQLDAALIDSRQR